MPKIKIREWEGKTGKKGKAYYYQYKVNGEWKSKQSKDKATLQIEVDKIEKQLSNVKSKIAISLNSSANKYWNNQSAKVGISINRDHIKDEQSIYNNHIMPLGDIDLRTITQDWVVDFIDKKRNQLKEPYLKRIFFVFKHIYDVNIPKHFKDSPFIATDHWVRGSGQLKTKNKIDFDRWSFAKIFELISYVKSKPIQLIFKLCVDTGCRPSEARACSKQNLKFKSNIPYYQIRHSLDRHKKIKETKTENGERDVVISKDLKDELMAYMNSLPKDQDYLFLNSQNKFIDLKRMTNELNFALKKIKDKYNLDSFVNRKTYMFRHWTASKWAYDGKFTNAIELAEQLGDKDINFVYKQYIKKYKKDHNMPSISEYKDKHNRWSKPLQTVA